MCVIVYLQNILGDYHRDTSLQFYNLVIMALQSTLQKKIYSVYFGSKWSQKDFNKVYFLILDEMR